MCFLTTWSIPLDNRFKELETTCTKPSWIGIKETQFQCFCLIESILLQFSDNTLVLSLTDCTKKVSKALTVLMGTQLKRTSCQAHARVQPRGLIIYRFSLEALEAVIMVQDPPGVQCWSTTKGEILVFNKTKQVEVGRIGLLASRTSCLELTCLLKCILFIHKRGIFSCVLSCPSRQGTIWKNSPCKTKSSPPIAEWVPSFPPLKANSFSAWSFQMYNIKSYTKKKKGLIVWATPQFRRGSVEHPSCIFCSCF